MTFPEIVANLVQRFQSDVTAYRSETYNEAQARQELIDPFFEALGWDMSNKDGAPLAYREVVHEDAIKVSGKSKAPDYSFRIGGVRKFFVEAKKPTVNLEDDARPAFQLRRYAWSSKLPVSILTDFEEFVIYDCRIVPDQNDKASTARTLYVPYTQYADRWDEIANLFSRESVQAGSLDTYAENNRNKRGIATVDHAFLREIESWRSILARDLATHNPYLSQRDLNFSVQMTIDRIIFLRICEDRGIEPYERLKEVIQSSSIYEALCRLFRQADDRYNSGLFHFKQERGRPELPDDLTLSLKISNAPLHQIIQNLYYPNSPYEFSVLPADILGQVYEQFLGKVIRLTSEHGVEIEEKPEVRKAGGVFYTPTYIVDYIVDHAVGNLLAGKTVKQAAKLKILDPACGSGSFLIGVYQYLLDWHLDQYAAMPKSRTKNKLVQGARGEWRLTADERKRILRNNIYGVDIDTQAVETTKLSLLLKVLEGETEQTLATQLRLLQERALPDLGENIKCGNSLIGSDFYGFQQLGFLEEEEHFRINVFDWSQEFAEIIRVGGFDAVVGNPPYVRTLHLTRDKDYYKRTYASATGSYDIFVLFMEVALRLVRRGGIIGFITPNKYFVADYAGSIRHQLLTDANITEIADLGKCKSVFDNALISTAITIFKKEPPTKFIDLKILSDDNVRQISEVPLTRVSRDSIVTSQGVIRVYQDVDSNKILEKIKAGSRLLKDVAQVRTGVMGFDYWAMDPCIADGNQGRRIATNSYLDRYQFLWGKKVRLYKREVFDPRISADCDVLSPNTVELFSKQKVLVRGVARRLTAMLDTEGVGLLVAVHAVIGESLSNEFLLGLLNSRLFDWIHIIQFYSARIPEGSLRYPISFLNHLPIRSLDLSLPADRDLHDQIVTLVRRMLVLQVQLSVAKTGHDQRVVQRQIDATDRQINQLVYSMYGLTTDEVEIVEAFYRLQPAGEKVNEDGE